MRLIATSCCTIFENSISSLERERFLYKETEHHKWTCLSLSLKRRKSQLCLHKEVEGAGEGCDRSMKGGLMIHQPVTPSHRLSEVIIFLPIQMLVHGHKPKTWILNSQRRYSWLCLNDFELPLFLVVLPHNCGSCWNTQQITMARPVLELQRNEEQQLAGYL